MMRALCVVSIVLGAALAAAFPKEVQGHQTGVNIIASLTPPTRVSGLNAELTCGWHPGDAACGDQSSGIALDWNELPPGDIGWYFRGYFVTSNPSGGPVVRGTPLVNQSGPEICDRMTVWITEYHHGTLRGAPIYTHTNITSSSVFTVSGTLFGTYFNRKIGNLIDDTGDNCAFAGTNLHEWHVPVNAPSTTTTVNTPKFPTAQTCGATEITCGNFKNNTSSNWTRRFSWAEGAP